MAVEQATLCGRHWRARDPEMMPAVARHVNCSSSLSSRARCFYSDDSSRRCTSACAYCSSWKGFGPVSLIDTIGKPLGMALGGRGETQESILPTNGMQRFRLLAAKSTYRSKHKYTAQ
eukprot:1537893-Pleurochrysis_carterae.AAC.1